MPATYTQTVNSVSSTLVQTSSYCREVEIGEDGSVSGWPTADLLIADPATPTVFIRIQQGSKPLFSAGAPRSYTPNTPICYVKTPSGSTTIFVHERIAP